MHGVMEAQHDAEFKMVLNSAALVVPDGMPLVMAWTAFGDFDLRAGSTGPN